MLRHAFRRLLWVFPSVLGVTLLSFFVLSLMPDPVARSTEQWSEAERADRLRRRHLDLPRFVNLHPKDARVRTEEAVSTLLSAEPWSTTADNAQRELVRIGGVALPFVLPTLDSLGPEARSRLALALAPLATRMGIARRGELGEAERAVLFWSRFWETRGVEFRSGTVRGAVERFANHGEEARAEDLEALDTFALSALMEELSVPTTRSEVERARRLVDLIAHVTGQDDRIAPEGDLAQARACVERWQRWWTVYQLDYEPLAGVPRMVAVFLETQFGKWVLEAVSPGSSDEAAGEPTFATLRDRARISLAILLLGLALAYAAAVPLGALCARLRGSAPERAITAAVLVPYALSPAVLGALGVALGWQRSAHAAGSIGALALAAGLLALGLLAEPTRQQRAALLPVLTEEYVRAAAARGVGPLRLYLVHGLRAALFPMVTRAPLELPAALTAVFVLERALGLPGLGDATLAAVASSDRHWLMALVLAGASWAVLSLVVSDVAYALLDPRLRQELLQRHRRGT